MTIEAMKQALEWAESHGEIVFAGGGINAVNGMNVWSQALRAAIEQAEKQKPVAWQATADKCQIQTVPAKGGLLPAAPPAAQPEQEPMADGLIRGYVNALVANKPDDAADATKCMVDYVFAIPPAAQPAVPLTTMQPIVDVNGVKRFKANAIVRHLIDTHPSCDMNVLSRMDFSDEDRMQFAQLIGYSLSGYSELSYVSDESYDAAEKAAHGIGEKK